MSRRRDRCDRDTVTSGVSRRLGDPDLVGFDRDVPVEVTVGVVAGDSTSAPASVSTSTVLLL